MAGVRAGLTKPGTEMQIPNRRDIMAFTDGKQVSC